MKPMPIFLLAGAALTIAIGLVSGGKWPGFVVGAVLALVLYLMLFAGTYAQPAGRRVRVAPQHYLTAAVITFGLGLVLYLMTDSLIWWPAAAIVAGAVIPATQAVQRPRSSADDARG
ncbi:YwiC-like family protein [Nakamurella aerolata]|uniref:Uncharacterized protein n=1 Tax=Nakamurella aerolata TaxID=1656892 RepID=A0A849ABR9_9ACTN|nr:YwiC-like family protein [Nakamurella aerolata]NNG37036.1 hypothetical protein [Nakamurella aerolata]